MLRFNGGGQFNLPVGNVDFNKNVVRALNDYFSFVRKQNIVFSSKDFRKFFAERKFLRNDFVYIDPPYLITASEYNKIWDERSEESLRDVLDNLTGKGVKFAMSNLTHYRGEKNDSLIRWMRRYHVHPIKSNYINYHDNRQKSIKEVLITNY